MKSVQGLKLDSVGREADVSDIVSFEPGPTANKQITKSVRKLVIKCLTGYLKTQIWKTVAPERPNSNNTFCKIFSELISWKICFEIIPKPEFKLQTNTTHFLWGITGIGLVIVAEKRSKEWCVDVCYCRTNARFELMSWTTKDTFEELSAIKLLLENSFIELCTFITNRSTVKPFINFYQIHIQN